MKRYAFVAVLGFIMITQYVNCSSYSDSVYEGSSSNSVSADSTPYQSLRVINTDVTMACYEDHIQVGGPCNTADAKDNYVQYWLTRDRQAVVWGSASSPVDHLTLGKCENGRFYVIVPKPYDPAGLGTSGKGIIEYQLNMQIWAPADGSTGYKAGELGAPFTFGIQKNANCGS